MPQAYKERTETNIMSTKDSSPILGNEALRKVMKPQSHPYASLLSPPRGNHFHKFDVNHSLVSFCIFTLYIWIPKYKIDFFCLFLNCTQMVSYNMYLSSTCIFNVVFQTCAESRGSNSFIFTVPQCVRSQMYWYILLWIDLLGCCCFFNFSFFQFFLLLQTIHQWAFLFPGLRV